MKLPNVDDIMRYEGGEMDDDELIDFFQRLLDSGMIWDLQGHYQRTAARMLSDGLITRR